MIKVVSFDIGGTLLLSNSERINDYSLEKLTELVGLPHSLVKNAYKKVFQKQKASLVELANNFCNLLGISCDDKIINFLQNKFSNDSLSANLNLEALPVMKKLKEQGYKVILFSNNCCLVDSKLLEDIMKYVDMVFYSYDIGYTKNEDESYKYIEKVLDVKSDEIIHIGDTLTSDYIIPRKNGWNSLFYGKNDNINVDSIESLNEILEYLNNNNQKKKEESENNEKNNFIAF